ncbi:polysaccharide biosynthesis tyrosine autokinase [Nucisporomicrobium flavum]|uniref:polysaccharide biosynthesis tyrosine autokinase n=1 Tax=Nucisporomicrobium flavum TaxID=2785915 RepID=UPI003C2C4E16
MTGGGPARLIRVHGWWILLVTVLVTAAAYAVGTTAPREFRAAAIVVVEPRVRANTTPVPPDMGTEKQLAQSGLVVDPAARRLGVDPGHLTGGLSVSVAPDADVLTFAYTDGDALTAQRRAQALAEAYVDYRNADDGPGGGPAPTQRATLVTDAALPGAPVRRPVTVDLGLGLLLGLLLGAGTALVRDRLSDRLRGRDDFARLLGGPVLAGVPRERRRRGEDPGRPVLLRAPHSPAAEAYRYLRSRLQPLLGDNTTVLVTSADGREGRTTAAANLATALAQSGRGVILVDADLCRPRVAAAFGLGDHPGLCDVLARDVPVGEALRHGPVPRLRLLTAGQRAPGAADLLGSARLPQVLRTLRGWCDVVVLDCSPVLAVSDAIVLAQLCDHVVLVGDLRRSTRGSVARAVAELSRGRLLGILLNAPRGRGSPAPRGDDPVPVPPGLPAVGSAPVAPTSPASAAPVSAAPVSATPVSPARASTLYGSAVSDNGRQPPP